MPVAPKTSQSQGATLAVPCQDNAVDSWVYEEVDLNNVKNTNSLLTRVMIGKITNEKRLIDIIESTPIV